MTAFDDDLENRVFRGPDVFRAGLRVYTQRAVRRHWRDRDSGRPRREAGRDNALRLLRWLYVVRVALSAVWVTIILELAPTATVDASRGVIFSIALAAYPAIDGLATLVDLRLTPSPAWRRLLWCNVLAGLAAASDIVWRPGSLEGNVRIFGIWAVVSGGTQLVLGVIRRGTRRGQWPMMISGGGSIVAGITFARAAESSATDLTALGQYAVGGAVWYLLTAGWFFFPLGGRRTREASAKGIRTRCFTHPAIQPHSRIPSAPGGLDLQKDHE
jgi:hypothetical protein